jgi:hypothetical protein
MQRPFSPVRLAVLAAPSAAPAGAEDLSAAIAAKAREIQPALVDVRRDLHRHPELSG